MNVKRPPRPTREYSRTFAKNARARRRQFNFDYVPPELHTAVRAKAKREGVSVRALVLAYLHDWAKAS
jgi:predicted HicB family RNase H-like nuclease